MQHPGKIWNENKFADHIKQTQRLAQGHPPVTARQIIKGKRERKAGNLARSGGSYWHIFIIKRTRTACIQISMQIQQNPDTVQANFEEFEVSSPLLLDKSSTLLGGAVGDSILTPAQRFFVETKEMNHLLEFFAKCKHPTPETKRIVSASPGTSSFNFQLPPPSKFQRKNKAEVTPNGQ